ncbi:RNA-directed DNA polymerase [Methanocorpusculum sp.]|nr:RNA-directed DNA polymerase [Methanocorpusculum sp.]
MAKICNFADRPSGLVGTFPLGKMKCTSTLEDVASYGNLLLAHANAKRGRTKYRAIQRVEKNKLECLRTIQTQLLSGTYQTSEYVHKIIRERGKERLISKLPYFPDRIVHWAYMQKLNPVFLAKFSNRSYASIAGKGIHAALYHVRFLLLHYPEETAYCLKIDMKKYFQNVSHDILKAQLRDDVEDSAFLVCLYELVDSFDSSSGSGCPVGLPLGNYTSQPFANRFLVPVDRWLEHKGIFHVRYMDDLVIFGKDAAECHAVLRELSDLLFLRFHLRIKENWQVFPVKKRAIDFLGYLISPNRVLIRKSRFLQLRRTLSRIRCKVLESGRMTDRDRSRIASYAGWLRFCTPKVKNTIWFRYFEPVLQLSGESKFRDKLYKMVIE